MRHARIIETLAKQTGGQAAMGRLFRPPLAESTISHWKDDGIPARHWPRVLELAQSYNVPLTLQDITSHSPLYRAPRRAA